jgi:hypothetical protein
MDGQYQNYIDDLPGLELYRYENIFKVYQTKDDYYFYNIIKNIQTPGDISSELFTIATLPENIPLTTLSYQLYGTTYLWWLICVLNDIRNPFDINTSGRKLKVLKREYLKPVLNTIKQQLQ